jgi:hypothetical protein
MPNLHEFTPGTSSRKTTSLCDDFIILITSLPGGEAKYKQIPRAPRY